MKKISLLLSLALTLSSVSGPASAAAGQIVQAPAGRSVLPGAARGTPGVSRLSAPKASGLGRAALSIRPAALRSAPLPDQRRTLARPSVAGLAGAAGASLASGQSTLARPTVLAGVGRAVSRNVDGSTLFDRAGTHGILPQKPIETPSGKKLDPKPVIPDSAAVKDQVKTNSFDAPEGAASPIELALPIVLNADPTSESDVERALRGVIDSNRAKFKVPSADLKLIHVKYLKGTTRVPTWKQADHFSGSFEQTKNGIVIEGSHINFRVNVIGGKAVLLGATSRLFPSIQAETVPNYSDMELQAKAEAKILEYGVPEEYARLLRYRSQRIIFTEGAWHTVNLYGMSGLPIAIAVDVVTGDAFAWDGRIGVQAAEPAAPTKIEGQVSGPVEMSDKRVNNVPNPTITGIPHLTFDLPGVGRVKTDANGDFSASISKEVSALIKLAGVYTTIHDQSGKPLEVPIKLVPGQNGKVKVVFNADAADPKEREKKIAQLNVYYHISTSADWLKAREIVDQRLEKHIPAYVNENDTCNAYFTVWSVHFFMENSQCRNTGFPGVIMHEFRGHAWDHAVGGIVHGGLSEALGDIASAMVLDSPLIGEGFLKGQKVSWIRDLRQTRAWNPNDEVHDQGEVFGQFFWKVYQALKPSLGAAAMAVAESLFLPIWFSKARDIPEAMALVLLNDMDKDGNMPHEKEIRAAARAHKVELPKNISGLLKLASAETDLPGGGVNGFLAGLSLKGKTFSRTFTTTPFGAPGPMEFTQTLEFNSDDTVIDNSNSIAGNPPASYKYAMEGRSVVVEVAPGRTERYTLSADGKSLRSERGMVLSAPGANRARTRISESVPFSVGGVVSKAGLRRLLTEKAFRMGLDLTIDETGADAWTLNVSGGKTKVKQFLKFADDMVRDLSF